MNVVRHNDIRMKIEVAQLLCAGVDGLDDHVGDLGFLEIEGSEASVIEQPIHGDEALARARVFGEGTTGWQATVQSPSEEHWLANRVDMRQSPPSIRCHSDKVPPRSENLRKSLVGQVCNLRPIFNRPSLGLTKSCSRPITNRPQIKNLPYILLFSLFVWLGNALSAASLHDCQ